MKKKPFAKLLTLACFSTLFSLAAIAQQTAGSQQIPEGRWVLEKESIRAFKVGCNHSVLGGHECSNSFSDVSMDEINVVLYTVLEVKQQSMSMESTKGTLKSTYTYDDMAGIRFDSKDIPFSPGGTVIDGKLYVQQRNVNPLDDSDIVYISFIYELKK